MAAVQELNTDTSEETEIIEEETEVTNAEGDTQSKAERVLCSFYLAGKCRFGNKCHNIHPKKEEKPDYSSKNHGKKQKKKVPEDVYIAKKPPLKTAGDVRHRILWDPALPQEHFTLGYVDRFVGLVEKPFNSFVWCDHLCNAGPEDLAIPQHCMSYFKYKGVKVWDKETRLDHVFGSAGNTMKIEQKMAEIDELVIKSLNEDEWNDDSDDDEFEMNVSGQRKIHEIGDETMKNSSELPLRATHFLCIKVNEQLVKDEIQKVQECVYMQDPTLRNCAMPTEILHVTLAMVNCETEEAVQRVGELLNSVRATVEEYVETAPDGEKSQRSIIASGLATFGARVLYTKLQVPESFNKAVETLREDIRKMPDAEITNNFEFVPHMTLLKVNKPTQRERRSKYMCSSLYDTYLNHSFGIINFDNIHFCSIEDFRGPDGFYKTVNRINF